MAQHGRILKATICGLACIAIAGLAAYIGGQAQPAAHASEPSSELTAMERVSGFALLGLDPSGLVVAGLSPQEVEQWLAAASTADSELSAALAAHADLIDSRAQHRVVRTRIAAGLMTDEQRALAAACETECAQRETALVQAKAAAIDALFDAAPGGVVAKQSAIEAVAGRRIGDLPQEYRLLDLTERQFHTLERALRRAAQGADLTQDDQDVLAVADAASAQLDTARAALQTNLQATLTSVLSATQE